MSILVGVIFAIFGYWFGMKEAKYWRYCWRTESELHRKNMNACSEMIIDLTRHMGRKNE